MHIRRYYTGEDPLGGMLWRYFVTSSDGRIWDVSIQQEKEGYCWDVDGDVLRLGPGSSPPFPSRERALDAAVKHIQRLGS